jgi:AcrR family transcriptional regulator
MEVGRFGFARVAARALPARSPPSGDRNATTSEADTIRPDFTEPKPTMARLREFDEEDAFSKALDVFWHKGLRGTTMLDLASATGIQRGSLYNAYGDKEEVFVRAFQRYAGRFLADVQKALSKPDLRTALTAFFDVSVRTITAGSPSRGCLSTRTAFDLDEASPRVAESLKAMLDTLGQLLMSALDTRERRAQLTMPPEQAVRLIVATTRGIGVLERVYGDRKSLKLTTAALVNALLKGRK